MKPNIFRGLLGNTKVQPNLQLSLTQAYCFIRGSRSSNSGSRLLNSGSRLLNSGSRLLNSGRRLLNSGCRLLNSGSRLLNSGSRLLNSGRRLSGYAKIFMSLRRQSLPVGYKEKQSQGLAIASLRDAPPTFRFVTLAMTMYI